MFVTSLPSLIRNSHGLQISAMVLHWQPVVRSGKMEITAQAQQHRKPKHWPRKVELNTSLGQVAWLPRKPTVRSGRNVATSPVSAEVCRDGGFQFSAGR